MTCYFGYGSNLDSIDWAQFCREHGLSCELRPIGPAWLPDHELAFNYRSQRRGGGALNIRRSVGKAAQGYLFETDEAGWAVLDRKEGVPSVYRRLDYVALDRQGREHHAITYEVVPERWTEFTPPSPAYLEICRRGRHERRLPLDDLDAVASGRPTSQCDCLFVYGTLLRGEMRASQMQRVRIDDIRDARVRGSLVDHGGAPGLVAVGEGWVTGELVRTREVAALLPHLDEVEEFRGFGRNDNLYRRSIIEVDAGNGAAVRAWTYLTLQVDAPPITGGDWRVHRRQLDARAAR